MTTKQKQLLESYIEKQVRKHLTESLVYSAIKKAVDGKSNNTTTKSGKWKIDMDYKYDLELAIYYDNTHIIDYSCGGRPLKVKDFNTYNEEEFKKQIIMVKDALIKLDYPVK